MGESPIPARTAKMSEAFFAALLAASSGDCKTACRILKEIAKEIAANYAKAEESKAKKKK